MPCKEKEKKRFFSNPGSQLAEKHAIRIDDFGHKTLVLTGEQTNIYVKILSHADECDIEALLARSEVEGYEILDRKAASYGDVTQVPKSLLEAQQMLQDRENEFNQLPLDVRKQFNFSFSEYIAEASKDINNWAKKMGFIKEPKSEPTEPITEKKEGGES